LRYKAARATETRGSQKTARYVIKLHNAATPLQRHAAAQSSVFRVAEHLSYIIEIDKFFTQKCSKQRVPKLTQKHRKRARCWTA
jgi:hypothetical protein